MRGISKSCWHRCVLLAFWFALGNAGSCNDELTTTLACDSPAQPERGASSRSHGDVNQRDMSHQPGDAALLIDGFAGHAHIVGLSTSRLCFPCDFSRRGDDPMRADPSAADSSDVHADWLVRWMMVEDLVPTTWRSRNRDNCHAAIVTMPVGLLAACSREPAAPRLAGAHRCAAHSIFEARSLLTEPLTIQLPQALLGK